MVFDGIGTFTGSLSGLTGFLNPVGNVFVALVGIAVPVEITRFGLVGGRVGFAPIGDDVFIGRVIRETGFLIVVKEVFGTLVERFVLFEVRDTVFVEVFFGGEVFVGGNGFSGWVGGRVGFVPIGDDVFIGRVIRETGFLIAVKEVFGTLVERFVLFEVRDTVFVEVFFGGEVFVGGNGSFGWVGDNTLPLRVHRPETRDAESTGRADDDDVDDYDGDGDGDSDDDDHGGGGGGVVVMVMMMMTVMMIMMVMVMMTMMMMMMTWLPTWSTACMPCRQHSPSMSTQTRD